VDLEHRHTLRWPTRSRLMLVHPWRGSWVAAVRDASLGGAFIEGASLPMHSPLTLLAVHDTLDGPDLLALPAMVVRTGRDGIGVALLEYDERRLLVWRDWLHAAHAAYLDAAAGAPDAAPLPAWPPGSAIASAA
jgi:hypothetical protein